MQAGFYSLNDILAKMQVNKTPVFLLYIVENARTTPRLVMNFGVRSDEKLAATADDSAKTKYIEQAQDALKRAVEVETAALGDNVLFEVTLKTAATTNESGTYPNQRFTMYGTNATDTATGLGNIVPPTNPLTGLEVMGGLAGFADHIRKDAVLSIREELLKQKQAEHAEIVAREREELKELRRKYEEHTDSIGDSLTKGLMGLISAFTGADTKALAGVAEEAIEPEPNDPKRAEVEELATALYSSGLTAEQIAILRQNLSAK